jgi:hypothetical protein
MFISGSFNIQYLLLLHSIPFEQFPFLTVLHSLRSTRNVFLAKYFHKKAIRGFSFLHHQILRRSRGALVQRRAVFWSRTELCSSTSHTGARLVKLDQSWINVLEDEWFISILHNRTKYSIIVQYTVTVTPKTPPHFLWDLRTFSWIVKKKIKCGQNTTAPTARQGVRMGGCSQMFLFMYATLSRPPHTHTLPQQGKEARRKAEEKGGWRGINRH